MVVNTTAMAACTGEARIPTEDGHSPRGQHSRDATPELQRLMEQVSQHDAGDDTVAKRVADERQTAQHDSTPRAPQALPTSETSISARRVSSN
jgi:hypothetical protein